MNVDIFNEFLTLTAMQSYADAAEELYISQASLSRHMKRLESDLNVQLFDRSSKKVCLTEYGLMLVPYAQEMVKTCNSLLDRYLYQINDKKQTINIGIANGCDLLVDINSIISAFTTEHPGTRFNITNDYTTLLLSSLRNHYYDFIFVREKHGVQDSLPRVIFAKDTLAAYMSISHPLAHNEVLRIEDLKLQPLVSTANSKLSSELLVNECKNCGFDPWITFQGTHEQISHYLRSGAGIAVLFKGIYSGRHTDHDIVIADIDPEISVDINFIYDIKCLTQVKKQFLDFLLERKTE